MGGEEAGEVGWNSEVFFFFWVGERGGMTEHQQLHTSFSLRGIKEEEGAGL